MDCLHYARCAEYGRWRILIGEIKDGFNNQNKAQFGIW